MIEAVIFDVDGTLIDSVDQHAEAWLRTLTHFGVQTDRATVRAQIGKGGDQLLPVFLSEEDIDRRGQAIEAWRSDLFKREYLPGLQGFPKVRELFDEIRAGGKRIALASSAKGDELGEYKRIAGIADLVDAETTSDDAERSKPHPDIFQAVLQKLELSPAAAIVIGDSPYDAEAAHEAGLATIGVLCGGFSEQELRAAGASEIYRGPADLLARYATSAICRRGARV